MMHKLTLTILSVLFAAILFGKEVAVKIEAPAYKGKQAQLIRFADYFTFTPELLAAERVAEDGTIILNGNCEGPELALLRIDHVNAYIYLSPNKELNVVFPPLPENAARTIANTNFVELSFVDLDPRDPNAELSLLNERIAEFYDQHITMHRVEDQKAAGQQVEAPGEGLAKDPPLEKFNLRSQIDNLKVELDEVFKGSSPFIQTEKDNAIALLYWNANVTRKWLYEHYFQGKPVQLTSPSWVDLFRSFYQEHFMLGPMFSKEVAFRQALENDKDPKALVAMLLENPLVSDSTLAELLALNGIYEYYHSGLFKKSAMREVLGKMRQDASTTELKGLAKNILTDLTSLEKGGAAPDFRLLNNDRDVVDLSTFEGQYLYIGFWASWCSSCLKELKVMKQRYEEYGQHVAFLTINIDDDVYERADALGDLDLPWTDVYHANDPLVLDRYRIRSAPQFFLIDPDGKMIDPMAARPSSGIAAQFHKIKVAAEKKERVKVWDD